MSGEPAERAELNRLRKENKDLKQANEILKLAWVADFTYVSTQTGPLPVTAR